ncbi:sugar kinase [Terrilactibacillus sp. BCM23-1]|uniref:Sugar kinase n=1 Tax=Terrilactibacillus tamarindi TaxID=2599694 RepID=A0A6N8CVN3_9BACI|nr:sugar kinase [Terrilactibacillus tamarindi]MTT32376.1 sugar kinase [Terrilactibacillus tamarindi]
MSEIITMGEAMAMFVADDEAPLSQVNHFTKYLAGAEVNVAIGVSRLGHTISYLSQVGRDPFGEYIQYMLEKEHISTDFIKVNDERPTGFQMKNKTSTTDPEVVYFRKNTAASTIDPAFINQMDFSDAKILHVTGIFPALSDETFEATLQAIQKAIENQMLVTFDPNLRPTLWKSEEEMVHKINLLAEKCDVFMPGFKEAKHLTGLTTKEEIANHYLAKGIKKIIIKLGTTGSYMRDHDSETFVKSFTVQPVDTVGAGDGFAVGILTGLLEELSPSALLTRANAIGAIQVTHLSDNEGLPTREELDHFIASYQKRSELI